MLSSHHLVGRFYMMTINKQPSLAIVKHARYESDHQIME